MNDTCKDILLKSVLNFIDSTKWFFIEPIDEYLIFYFPPSNHKTFVLFSFFYKSINGITINLN